MAKKIAAQKNETERQRVVWNKIALPWRTFRTKPVKEAVDFLSSEIRNKQNRHGKFKILDLGCGSGRNFADIKNSEIYAVDFSEQQLKHAREHAKKLGISIKAVKAYAYKLPFKKNFFDAAIFIATLHCIPSAEKRKKAVHELKRVMKKGASAMITAWDKSQPRFANSNQESFMPWKYNGREYLRYYYLYGRNELLKLLKEEGFKIAKAFETASKGLYSSRNIVVVARKE